MALIYRPVMVEDNGPSRTQVQEEERKRKQAEQQAMVADPRANMQMAYSTATKTATTPAAAKSPYEQRQAEIKAGVNKAQPISYAAPAREEEGEEQVQQKKSTGGNMANIPHHTRSAAELESQWFAPQEEEEEAPAAARPKAANAEPETKTAAPQTVSEATDIVISEPRRKGEQKAEEFTRLTYTGGDIAQKNTNVGTASQTKAAITGEEEEEPQWMKDLAEANAEDRRRRQAVANANQDLAIRAMNAGPQYDQGSIDAMRNDALQQINRNRQLQEDAQAAAQAASVEQARQWADAYAAARRRGYLPDPQVITTTQQPSGTTQPTIGQTVTQFLNNAGMHLPVSQEQQIPEEATVPTYGQVLQQIGRNIVATPEKTGTAEDLSYSWQPTYPDTSGAGNPYYGQNSQPIWGAIANQNQLYQEGYREALNQPGWTERDRRAYAEYYAKQKGAVNPLFASNEQLGLEQPERPQRQTGSAEAAASTNRPGASAALEDIMNGTTAEDFVQNYGAAKRENYEATNESVQQAVKANESRGVESTATASKESTTTSSGKNPKGTQYLTPSYGQEGKVVKLPYKAGGYTAAELEAAGNNARSDQKYYNGSKAYEGYYLAPDGKYYPVDQEKAAYYLRNGYSYEGWEEPMRDYYKTFGTFFGYRPDWKKSGKTTGGGGYSYSPSYSYSRGGSSYGSGRSYGRGSTPNNGLYWNGNTSWSI